MPRGTQVINGTEYVYEYDSTWAKEKKYGTHKRNYIGKIVDGEFVPNKKYKLQMELEESKKKGPVPVTECQRRFYGATYLFDAISEKLGLGFDLKKCFPDTYKKILSVSYYLILEDRNPLSRFGKWARTHVHPFGKELPSQRSSELFYSIEENAKNEFFRLQCARRLYLHLFYNDQQAADDKAAFNDLLDRLELELLSGKPDPAREKLYKRYFEINKTPVRGVKLTPKQEAICATEKNYGYFALLSNEIKDPLTALDIYRGKDLIEKAFGNLKARLNLRRTAVSTEENLDGKLFVQFVALIYLAYIDARMREKGLYRDYTLQELLDEFDIIERFEHPGKQSHLGEITKKQLELYRLLEVEPPA